MKRAVRLHELQSRFAVSLAKSGLADDRLAIYRNTISANYRNALAATYPVVRALTGRAAFDALVGAYVTAYPSRSGDLNVFGGAFADLLALHPHWRAFGYLPDVARLEWAIDEAGRAADTPYGPRRVIEALGTVPAQELGQQRFVLDGSCRFIDSSYPLYEIWQAKQAAYPGEASVEENREARPVVVRRSREGIVVESVGAAEFAWLTALAEGADLERAVEAAVTVDDSFDLGRVLHSRIADGTLVGVAAR